ncbi:MAG: nicotinate-nicotinamide nucleotide adenylyltransferase [Phycisphaerales bacterium]|nr:nicotinate-nicotinamide nucleotide adenylyltransferase [Phycisphaerales bacterium]
MAMPPAGAPHPITPLPAPKGAEAIVLVGGTFDPPHRAHVELPALARDRAAGPGAWLVFVPAARSPCKAGLPTPAAERVMLLRLALAATPRAAIWTDEIDRADPGAPSYWVDTLRRAIAVRPESRFWFVIGADQAAAFHRWREPRAILALASPIVVPRAPTATAAALREELEASGFWSEAEVAHWLGALADVPPVVGSATEIRAALASEDPDAPVLHRLLDPAVLRAIRHAHLYRPHDGSDQSPDQREGPAT